MGMSDGNFTCPSEPTGPQYGAEHIAGSMTFHDITVYLCAGLTAVTCLISGALLLLHATHFSNPREQTHILRIASLVPLYAILYFISGTALESAIYVQPWADVYEAYSLASYFLLLVSYLVPEPERRDSHFEQLELQDYKGKVLSGGSSKWFRRIWVMTFQYIPVAFLVAVFTDITQAAGQYCYQSNNPHHAKLWLTIIKSVSVSLAFLRLLQFYHRLRVPLKPYNVVAKLTAIKGIVGLTFLQSIIFTILNDTGAVDPSPKLSYNDIQFGMPAILICGEMVFFSLFNFYAYNPRPYMLGSGSGVPANSIKPVALARYHGGPLGIRAILAAMNPVETLLGLVTAARYLVTNPRPSSSPTGYGDGDSRIDMEPLRQGYQVRVDSPTNSTPPPQYDYSAYHGAGGQVSGVERAHSPDSRGSRSPEPGADDGYESGPKVGQYSPLPPRREL